MDRKWITVISLYKKTGLIPGCNHNQSIKSKKQHLQMNTVDMVQKSGRFFAGELKGRIPADRELLTEFSFSPGKPEKVLHPSPK